MKYRSLLSDVSLKASMISRKVSNMKLQQSHHTSVSSSGPDRRCRSFKQLPIEIQVTIFTYVNDHRSYRNCLYTSKKFYQLAKPFLFRSVAFNSTYRFAQFITCLRLNSALGAFVLEVDLSGILPGNAEVMSATEDNNVEDSLSTPEEIAEYISQVLAGWRDWKFKNNSSALYPVAVPLSKSYTNLAAATQNESKRIKISKYFKRRRSSTNVTPPSFSLGSLAHIPNTRAPHSTAHPKTNRFLSDYASSKDIPVGYVLHLINLCPNVISLNLANVSLSADYRVKRAFQSRYPHYDIVNNFPKDMSKIIETVSPNVQVTDYAGFDSSYKSPFAEIASSASSVFSIGTFSKPTRKYNSLLPPVQIVSPDLHYANKADGQLFLSDLSLKSINTTHLEMVQQSEIFACLQKRQSTLSYINMSSMIWLNLKLVRSYLSTVLAADLKEKDINGKARTTFKNKVFEIGGNLEIESREGASKGSRSFVLDLRNSGMNKNLPWAQLIDTDSISGERLIYRIINDELVSEEEENIVRERNRRGRAGENYFS
ncbi:hypothetical protein JCM33374_g2090 [Metschnikowia sp. JCM 33374]|nr:hypothetical protein JCM33374_g2090 [Metschnikowia sp. JCM 33374]